MAFQRRDDTQVKRVPNIFSLKIDDRDASSSARPRRERLVGSKGPGVVALQPKMHSRLGPFAGQEVLCRSGSLLVAQRG